MTPKPVSSRLTNATIQIIGLGYMGLPMAAILANRGLKVIGVDIDKRKLTELRRGQVTINEPGLSAIVQQAITSRRLQFSHRPKRAQFHIVAVPTPFVPAVRLADLSHVRAATESIVPVLKKGDIVILESTVPPATCRRVMQPILEKSGLRAEQDFSIVHCPERAFPGNTLYEIVHNDRIIGGDNPAAVTKVEQLYRNFVVGQIYTTSSETAEMVKLMENTYRDTNIALANEFAQIAEGIGVDVWEAISLANKHPRVNIHWPGPGVGGHCIAIDPWFLKEISPMAELIKTARHINDDMPVHVVRLAEQFFPADTKIITILGVAYKPNVDDARETPARHIIDILKQKGFEVRVHDYFVTEPSFETTELAVALQGADGLILVTHHDDYKTVDPKLAKQLMRQHYVIDTRSHLDHHRWRQAGFKVKILGNSRSDLA